jgi:hypothetical protein
MQVNFKKTRLVQRNMRNKSSSQEILVNIQQDLKSIHNLSINASDT